MDWLSEHWPTIAFILTVVTKFAQDHLRISQHEKRIEDLEDLLRTQQVMQAEQAKDIKHIRNTTDALAQRQGITEQDIKDIIRK